MGRRPVGRPRAADKAGQLQFFGQHMASASNVQSDNRTLKENFRVWVLRLRDNFSRNSDRLGDLPVADLRLRGLDQRRDPPYRGHARSRPCSPPLRCRLRSAARSITSRTSTTVRHEQRLNPPP